MRCGAVRCSAMRREAVRGGTRERYFFGRVVALGFSVRACSTQRANSRSSSAWSSMTASGMPTESFITVLYCSTTASGYCSRNAAREVPLGRQEAEHIPVHRGVPGLLALRLELGCFGDQRLVDGELRLACDRHAASVRSLFAALPPRQVGARILILPR